MNQTQAMAKLRAMLGGKLGYRVDKNAPDAARREEIRATWQAAKNLADEAVAARKARYLELMQDESYQALCAAAKVAQDKADAAGAGLHRHRVVVGVVTGPFFSIEAEGDNWAEVVEKVAHKRGGAR